MLDEGYPREISVGFDKIPDYVDAAFALPSPAHHEKEKVFFFRGNEKQNKALPMIATPTDSFRVLFPSQAITCTSQDALI